MTNIIQTVFTNNIDDNLIMIKTSIVYNLLRINLFKIIAIRTSLACELVLTSECFHLYLIDVYTLTFRLLILVILRIILNPTLIFSPYDNTP